jgi:hypothetical protein
MYITTASLILQPKTLDPYLQICTDVPDLVLEMISLLSDVECKEVSRRSVYWRLRPVTLLNLSFTKGMIKVIRTFPPDEHICRGHKWTYWKLVEKLSCK